MRTSGIQFGRRWATAFAGIAIVAAACTSSGGGAGVYGDGATSAPAASPAAASAAAASTAPSAAAGGGKYATGNEDDYGTPASKPPAASAGAAGATAIAVANGAVGAFLTGADGMTLYIFKKDSAGKSACEGGCATNWPPLVADGGAVPTAGDGVTGALTTFARPDGSMQVAYKGAPLYYYAGDTAAGDTNGQGVGGTGSSRRRRLTARPASEPSAVTRYAAASCCLGPPSVWIGSVPSAASTNVRAIRPKTIGRPAASPACSMITP